MKNMKELGMIGGIVGGCYLRFWWIAVPPSRAWAGKHYTTNIILGTGILFHRQGRFRCSNLSECC